MKQIRYKGKDFTVKLVQQEGHSTLDRAHDKIIHHNFCWKLFIDQWIIEIKQLNNDLRDDIFSLASHRK